MAIGNPLLAVWDVDSVLRTFEYVGGTFIQLASVGSIVHAPSATGLTAGADPAPYLRWMRDDSYLAVLRCSTASVVGAQVFSPALGSVTAFTTIATGISSGFLADEYEPNSQIGILYSSFAALQQIKIAANGALVIPANVPGSASYLGAMDFVATKDGENFLASYDNTKQFPVRLWYRYGSPMDDTLGYAVGAVPVFSTTFARLMATSYNLLNLVTIGVNGQCKVWHMVANDGTEPDYAYLHDLAVPAGTAKNIAMSRDNKYMAISALNGGTYTTFIYQRIGEYFQYTQTLTGIGQLLEFSHDGMMLIDCALKQCYLLSGDTFNAHHAALTNIPSLVQAQALSKGRVAPNGYSYLYEAAVEWFANDDVDLTDLKIDFLTASASFNETHTAISTVTNGGAYRTTTGAWPVGGLPLENVARVAGNGTLSIEADDLSYIVLDNNLTARYAVIYEVTTGRPLIWIDLNQTRTVSRGREILINFRSGELLKFSK